MPGDNPYVPENVDVLTRRALLSLVRQYEEMLSALPGQPNPTIQEVERQVKEGLQVVVEELKER